MPEKIKNILLDRDGTIIRDMNYLSHPENIVFLDNAANSLYRLYSSGMKLFLVTNQSGIGRGYFSHQDFCKVQDKLRSELGKSGVFFASEAYCPHDPADLCSCRKPDPGLWEQLQHSEHLLPEESLIIGDKLADIKFGLNSGLKYTILVLTGKGSREMDKLDISVPDFKDFYELQDVQTPHTPHVIARDLQAAANWILDTGMGANNKQ